MKLKWFQQGKYNLLHYAVKDELILYHSSNRNKKYIGIAIFTHHNFLQVVKILNPYLLKNYFNFYSIQIPIGTSLKFSFILNFKDREEENIIKKFQSLYKIIKKSFPLTSFLNKDVLEAEYMNFLIKKQEGMKFLNRNNEIFGIKNENISLLINCYSMNLDLILDKNNFLTTFLEVLKNLKRKGLFIFTFKKDPMNFIKTSPYLIDIRMKNEDFINIQKEINDFYGIMLMNKIKLNFNHLFKIFWRLNISNNWFHLKKVLNLFHLEGTYDDNFTHNSLDSIKKKMQSFLSNSIQINKYTYLIDNKVIFHVVEHVNSDLIKLIEKFILKYNIIIITLKKEIYNKLKQIKKIESFKKFYILHIDDFLDLNLNQLKYEIKMR